LAPRTGFPLNCRTRPLLGANRHNTVHHSPLCTDTCLDPRFGAHLPSSRGSGSPPFARLLVSRATCDSRCGRFPRCWCRFLRCRPSSSPASPGSTDSEGVDRPAEVSPAEDSGIGSRRSPSQGGRARSPWPTSRARPRGLSIVLGSPLPSTGSSSQARRAVAPLVVDHGGPAAAATGLPPVSSYVPTPLVEAESARLSPPSDS